MSSDSRDQFAAPIPPLSPTAAAAIGGIPTRRRHFCSSPRSPATAPEPEMAPGTTAAGGLLEDFLIISGLVAVQVVSALYMVALKPILSLGINPLFLIVFGSFATAFFIFPFAVALEKKKWPSKLRLTLLAQFILIALGGVTTFQALMFVGIRKTSPAIASAMPNLAPGIIFIIASCLRFERVDLKCKYSRTKILGTLFCLLGAIILSLLQTPVEPANNNLQTASALQESGAYRDWIVGCSCLLAAVLVLSCSTVLQAATMTDFPAPFSLCVVTSLMGAVLTAIVQVITEGKVDIGQPKISIQAIFAIVFLGGMVIAICVAFQTWAVLRKGPVMVSMFSPIQTVCSAILSATILGQVIELGSVAGMFFMFFGLYIVLWAKKKEGFGLTGADDEENFTESAGNDHDIERPLLT
ncbi:WAT1-related protein [Apostasia shenzhenica]|uniref:WAT1-related protein n=1 Tax=Apostasia shenzhenica TaxID=1088818 RepID=A0A2H9ZT41_9ASPA|nr:WAT1-related protein [Apostasia shenzhenica]